MIAEPPSSLSTLPGVLVRISRECESAIEHLQAEQLVREARTAWPGSEPEHWAKWLTEACRSLNLRVIEADLELEAARRLADDGATVVGLWRPDDGPLILLGRKHVAEGEIDERRRISTAHLRAAREASPAPQRWLVVTHAEHFEAGAGERLAERPLTRLLRLLQPEWNDIWLVLLFAFFASVLSLSVPIAVETLVNTIAFGRMLQPVVVLAAILFGFLAFAGSMRAMQTYVAEIIQRRLFARVSADFAHRLPGIDHARLDGAYAPELANRFLAVATMQKVVAQLLLDGVNIVLATLVGMTVLASYHPWLLGFDVLLLGLVTTGLVVLGRGAIRTGIDESKYKFRLQAWFEDLTRCPTAFKAEGGAEFAADHANLLATSYLRHRRAHFRVLFRQIVFVLALQAIAGTILLGGGGWLVIRDQLSLGQLVAAELIVSMILASMAKIGKHLEGFYDLVAAIDKLGILFDLPLEHHDGMLALTSEAEGIRVALKNTQIAGVEGLASEGLHLQISAGERVALYGRSNSGKSALCQVLYGASKPQAGRVTLSGLEPTDLRPDVLRDAVALTAEPEIFDGTLADNVHLRRRELGTKETLAALEAVGLLETCLDLPQGLATPLTAAAAPLTGGQQRLLMLARAIATKPKLLLIDATLDALPDEQLDTVLAAVLDPQQAWTVVLATGRRDIADRMPRTVELTPLPSPGLAASLTGRES
ncbi:ATP-binding cassette domain-containing protein [Roseimaritima sediminicola]|uniref:ATP-binding cassette domain-containing protein n=1 Tax=Roseimaritima sediminicola TaxID=2662066 RepID=UPI0012984CD0|nr:ABC transporter ATP-binding protein/permease [Roseimaritima sediminicola]